MDCNVDIPTIAKRAGDLQVGDKIVPFVGARGYSTVTGLIDNLYAAAFGRPRSILVSHGPHTQFAVGADDYVEVLP